MSPPGGTARSAKGAPISAFRLALSLLIAALGAQAHGAGAPIVRTRIAPASVTIGQPVTLTIDVLVPTWFGGGIEYPPALAVPDAVATLSDERAVNLNERIGGESYAGMTKSYVIVPQKAGAFAVPAVALRVPYAVDGKTVVADVQTAPQRFEARLPPGAADLGYFIATPSYRLTQQIAPPLARLKAGDAVTRTITQRAVDLAPMFLPALRFEPIDGLELYAAQPVLAEQGGERGAPRLASRTDAVTYVLAKPGRYRLPGVRIGWFAPGGAAMRWAEVPELAFEVAPNPALAVAPAATVAGPSRASSPPFARIAGAWREALAALVSLLLAGVILRWLVPVARRGIGDRRARRAAAEATAFRRFRVAARGGKAADMHRAAAAWVERVAPAGGRATLAHFARDHGDDDLAAQVASLDRWLYGADAQHGVAWSAPAFARGMTAARRRWARSRRRARTLADAIAPLNPGGERIS